jgi:endonuclease/exonuclease/phosphatase family metal-dependent hydrolase
VDRAAKESLQAGGSLMPRVRLATFNAYNVYDKIDNPKLKHDRPKPEHSLRAVANILSDSQADVVSLQEIENVEILEELRSKGGLAEQFPYYCLVEGNDRKGIDVCVMSRYPIRRYESHRNEVIGHDRGRPRRFLRDLLEVDLELPEGKTLRVFSNHYVKQGNSWCDQQRLAEAQATARIVRDAACEIPTDHSVVLGDFNDRDGSPTLRALEGQGLTNITKHLPPSWGVVRPHSVYAAVGLDHIFVSDSLRKSWLRSGVFDHPQSALASDHQLVWSDFLVS